MMVFLGSESNYVTDTKEERDEGILIKRSVSAPTKCIVFAF